MKKLKPEEIRQWLQKLAEEALSFPRTINLPSFLGEMWIEIEIYRQKYFELSIKEIYKVPEQHQNILGKTDGRTIFEIGFRIPFVRESQN